MAEEFDPYLHWLGIRDPERPPNHYRLLGVTQFEDDPEVLSNAADRQMSHVRTFQTGRHSAESQRLLNELAAAKICLLGAEKKGAYDAELRSRLARDAVAPPIAPPAPPWQEPPIEPPASPSNVFLETPIVTPAPRRPKIVRSSRRDSTSAALVATLVGVLALLILGLIFLLTKFNESRAKPRGRSAATQRLSEKYVGQAVPDTSGSAAEFVGEFAEESYPLTTGSSSPFVKQ